MRILVHPHDMQLGGSSINAVDLARTVRDLGHDVWVMGRQGPLRQRVAAAGLPLLAVPEQARVRPSPAVARAIATAVRRHRIDVVHTYEYWPLVEAFLGTTVPAGTPLLGTVMSMGALPPYFPRTVALTVGYGELYEETGRRHGAPVHLLEPPVDTAVDRPAHEPPGLDVAAFAAAHGLEDPAPTVVVVSRLAGHLKREHLERAVDAVPALSGLVPGARLVVVGGGSIESELRARGAAVNAGLGREAVVFTGPMADPRPAYAFADVVLGMGSSVLRGMAFGKPAVVAGEQGFSLPVTPGTVRRFDALGFYGLGDGRLPAALDPLAGQLADALADPARRERTGAWSLALVRERFALDTLAARLVEWYGQACESTPTARDRADEALRVTARLARFKAAQRRAASRRGGTT